MSILRNGREKIIVCFTSFFMVLLTLTVILAGIPVSAYAGTARIEERLAHIFQDNMVLQRETPVPVWGWAKSGEQVTVSFGGQKKQTKADEHGYWKVLLEPLPASREGRVLEVRIGATAINLKNVLVGEVWIAAGQSNMVAGGPDKDTGVYPHYISQGLKGGKPEIRICNFGFGVSLEPLEDIDTAKRGSEPWQVLKEDPPPPIMSLSYYFARVLRDALEVPVGIVLVAVPGTNQAAWMAKETLESFQGKNKETNFYKEFFNYSEDRIAKSAGKVKSWADFKEVETSWRETKKGPWPGNLDLLNFPAVLYNTRIFPLAPFAIRGVIWHQGEGGPFGPYAERLIAMIKQWRGLFGQNFNFIWGTLSRDTSQPPPLVPIRTWFSRSLVNTYLWQALKLSKEDKNVALVDFYDLGDEQVHWTEKAEGGYRMCLAALNSAYGQNHIYSGPRMTEAKIEGDKAVIRFEFTGKGLVYLPSIDGISGFCLHGKGKSGLNRWGQVKLTGKDTLEVSHPDITELETVAYAENQDPHETIFSGEGLPASPFTINPATNVIFSGDPSCMALPQLLVLQDTKAGVILNICHVRRGGYVFWPKLKDGKTAVHAPVTVQAYIPAEWKGFEVEAGGKRLKFTESSKDGSKFITFDAPMDGTWSIVAEAGKVSEFRKVNRF